MKLRDHWELTQRREVAKTQRHTSGYYSSASLRLCAFAFNVRSRHAFSLVELMVVVALIGIMTAMILPAMKGTYHDALLRSTGRRLVDVLNLANSRAVTINQLHQVRFDKKSNRYLLERNFHDPNKGRGFAPVSDIHGSDGEINKAISIEVRKADQSMRDPAEEPSTAKEARNANNPDAIAFYADGTAEASEIVLQDREGFRLALRINPITARVRIVELDRE